MSTSATATSGGVDLTPGSGQLLAALTAVGAAFFLLSQRITTDVSGRSRRIVALLERPG